MIHEYENSNQWGDWWPEELVLQRGYKIGEEYYVPCEPDDIVTYEDLIRVKEFHENYGQGEGIVFAYANWYGMNGRYAIQAVREFAKQSDIHPSAAPWPLRLKGFAPLKPSTNPHYSQPLPLP